ncbi:rhodanese-like domain-containing protein [Paracoccaceae bacterium]|nr:rhodanese-like domain-containing protein [Paracoccaceae bacterium]
MKIVRKTHLVQRYFAALVMAIAGLLAPVVWATETQSMGYNLSSAELMTYQSNGVVIVDIRRNEEWRDTGIINGAKTITAFTKAGSLHPDFQEKFTELVSDPDTPFVLYCRSGRRTGILRDALETSMGFTKAMHLSGGIVGWKKDGKNLVNYTP